MSRQLRPMGGVNVCAILAGVFVGLLVGLSHSLWVQWHVNEAAQAHAARERLSRRVALQHRREAEQLREAALTAARERAK